MSNSMHWFYDGKWSVKPRAGDTIDDWEEGLKSDGWKFPPHHVFISDTVGLEYTTDIATDSRFLVMWSGGDGVLREIECAGLPQFIEVMSKLVVIMKAEYENE